MDQYCVVGNPIEHSLSPFIQNHFAKSTNKNLMYSKHLVELDKFKETIQDLFSNGFLGCNVTVPFKEQAYAMCHKLTERAKQAQSVNTLKYEDGIIFGDNTDGAGLVKDLTVGKNIVLKDKTILVIGAGGAAKGIIGSLLMQGPKKVIITNRTISKAVSLANHFQHLGNVCYAEIDCIAHGVDVVINATSSSLKGELPPLDTSLINESVVVYDLMYSAKPTVFVQFASELGAVAYDGLGMLIEQAAESFNFWRRIEPSTDGLIETIRSGLN